MRSGSAKASGFSRTAFTTLNIAVFADPDRIVTLSSLWKRSSGHGQVSAPDYHDWHNQSTAFEEMAYYQDDDVSVTAGPVAEYAHVAQVTPEFFRVFQVEPAVGREFSSDETKQGSSGAAIISSAYSANHFGGISQALGHSLRLGGRNFEIDGVMPPGFRLAVGVFLSIWVSRVLLALSPADVPRLAETVIDSRVLAFAFGASLLASLLF